MTAWELLLAKSSLTIGNAWQHLTSALQFGSGLVINDGVYVEIQNMEIEATVDDTGMVVELEDIIFDMVSLDAITENNLIQITVEANE